MLRRELDRTVAPAGLDLGQVPNREIAAGIVADLVARRARSELRVRIQAADVPERVAAVDPVCGMTVIVGEARHHTVHEGSGHYFCAAGCLRLFEAQPVAFLG